MPDIMYVIMDPDSTRSDSGRSRSRSNTRRTFLTTAAAGVAVTAGCLTGANGGDEEDGSDEPITIGGLQPFSGPFSIYGSMHDAGAQFAAEELNQEGGVLGREIDVEAVDTESSPGEAATIFSRLVEEDGAVSIIGPVSSDVAVNVAQNAEDMEVPMFIHAGGDPAEVTRESRYTFRTANPPAPVTARSFAELIDERGYATVSAIIADYAWGRAMEASLLEFLPDDIDLDIAVAPFGEDDFTPYLRDFSDDTELLIGSGHPAGVNSMYGQAREIGLTPDLFTAAIAPTTASIGAVGEEITEGYTTLTQPDLYSDRFAEVATEFHEETGEQFDTAHASGYATVKLIAAAIEDAESTDPADVAESIRNIEFDTLYAAPIQYTEYGELDQVVQLISGYEFGDTPYPPEAEIRPTEVFRSDPLDAYDPAEFEL